MKEPVIIRKFNQLPLKMFIERNGLTEFMKKLTSKRWKEGDVKAKFPFEINQNRDKLITHEVMWIDITGMDFSNVDNIIVYGKIDNIPEYSKSFKLGQEVQVPLSDMINFCFKGDYFIDPYL